MDAPGLQLVDRLELLQLIVHNVGEGVIVADTEGRFLLFNRAAERILGKGMRDVPAEQWSAEYGILRADDKTPFPSAELPLARAIRGETVEGVELFIRNPRIPEGVYVTATASPLRDLMGRLVGGVSIFRDSTRERRAQETLRRLAAVTASSYDAILALAPDGRIATANPAACALWRMGEAALRGRSLVELASPASRASLAKALETAGSGAPGARLEARFPVGDATIIGAVSVAPIRGPSGNPTGLTAVVRDVTEARKVEQMKDGLLAIASHELRAPAAAIQISIELANELLVQRKPEQARETLMVALKNSDRLVRLFTECLGAERLRAGAVAFHPKPVELAELAREVVMLNAPFAGRFGVTLRVEALEAVWAKADRDALIQVLSNLVGNAAKFSPKGSTVEVRVGTREGKPCLYVVDRGPGIPLDVRDRIFEKFTRARAVETANVEGAGLGLHIAKQLVDGMGGRIGFETELGRGSRFFVELPPSSSP